MVADLIWYISIFSPVLPLLALTLKLRPTSQRYVNYLFLLISISFGADIMGLIEANNSRSTAFSVNIQDVLQFILLLMIYREFYVKNLKTIIGLATIYLGFEITNSLFYQDINSFQTWTWTFGSIIIVGMSNGYFIYMLKKTQVVNITRYAPVWINAGIVFYFTYSLYLFIVANYIFSNASDEATMAFWGFHNVNNIVKNICFAVGIYVGEEKAKGIGVNS